MPDEVVKIPGPDHPLTIEPARERVVVRVGDRVIADTDHSLVLKEASYPAVRYIRRSDADMAALRRSDTTSYCPYKGRAVYYSIPCGGERSIDAIWTYEDPHPAAEQIRDYLAFYPDRVDSLLVDGEPVG